MIRYKRDAYGEWSKEEVREVGLSEEEKKKLLDLNDYLIRLNINANLEIEDNRVKWLDIIACSTGTNSFDVAQDIDWYLD